MNSLLASRIRSLRCLSTSAHQLKNKVPEYQKIFQEDNGLPVHLKGGTKDLVLYRITMTLTTVGKCALGYPSNILPDIGVGDPGCERIPGYSFYCSEFRKVPFLDYSFLDP
uniref:Cytochrome c oxidase subunit 7A1, mitochondrial n=1 Tax=Salvator merianae TaxID=96440 RepID=A0A8D0CDT6_SALMN